MKLLNIGCGSVFHPEWTNIDIVSNSIHVQAYDIRMGIPFEDQTFDGVYASHILEHLKMTEVNGFMSEISRLLKPGGILRLVVPNLEDIAKGYLEALNNVRNDRSPITEANYDWMMLELYDQTVRSSTGGAMAEYLSSSNILNKEFVTKRIGMQADPYFASNLDPAHLKTIMKDERKMLIFGAGSFGQRIIKELQGCGKDVAFVIDNDTGKWGGKLNGIDIIGLAQIPNDSLIVVASSWWKEIQTQLESAGYRLDTDFLICKVGAASTGDPVKRSGQVDLDHLYNLITQHLGDLGAEAFREALFRSSGEVHRWMYDSFSLGRLMRKYGFSDTYSCAATESRIPGFVSYNLDTVNGKVRKPDSLFMEGIKAQ